MRRRVTRLRSECLFYLIGALFSSLPSPHCNPNSDSLASIAAPHALKTSISPHPTHNLLTPFRDPSIPPHQPPPTLTNHPHPYDPQLSSRRLSTPNILQKPIPLRQPIQTIISFRPRPDEAAQGVDLVFARVAAVLVDFADTDLD